MKCFDGKCRCSWVNPRNSLYIRYHDQEWGVPVREDQKLFEMLVLETFQAGLSWECVLMKREAFRRVFHGFDPEAVARMENHELEALASDPSIIRNRRKILATRDNARVFLQIQQEFGSFSRYLWGFTEGRIINEQGLTVSPLSDAVSSDLRRRGMKFMGSTTVYAYLQAVGILFGHEAGCFLSADE